MSSIIVDNVSKSFNGRSLFSELSFQVAAGEMTALTGPSGSGKSTLLNCIGLLEPLDKGKIFVGRKEVLRMNPGARRRFRRDTLGYMFQNYALIENATINHNLEIALAAKGRSAISNADFESALKRVGLAGRGKEPVYTLSGGEQQRVALARLIVKKPSIILADEPTGALDSANSEMVLAELDRIAHEGAAVILATHSDQVINACNQAISLV